MSKFKQGDRVFVTDPALAQLRAIMSRYGHEAKPNHHGTVEEVWEEYGSVLIYFDDGGSAPYPEAEVRHLTTEDN